MRARLQPALLGGAFTGVLSALPYVEYGNLCCCLWVVSGGILAAYLMQENQPAPVTAGDGAIVGLLAGLVGAVLSTILDAVFMVATGPPRFDALFEDMPNVPPDVAELVDRLGQVPLGVWLIFSLVVSLVVFAIFSTGGGILGAVLFRRKPLPQPPPPPPPVGTLPPLP